MDRIKMMCPAYPVLLFSFNKPVERSPKHVLLEETSAMLFGNQGKINDGNDVTIQKSINNAPKAHFSLLSLYRSIVTIVDFFVSAQQILNKIRLK